MVAIDEPFPWSTNGTTWWAHLFADTPEELHAAARMLGLRRAWFQYQRHPHYDLKGGVLRRAQAMYPTVTGRAKIAMLARCREAMRGG